MDRTPQVIVIAGPNGAGKSTMAPALLQGALGVPQFVNADTVASGLSAFQPEGAALEAAKIMLRRLRSLALARADFAFETTLSGRSYAPWLAGLRKNGYCIRLLYLWLPSPELAVTRVADRVRLGGHTVPEDVIRRRYAASLRNFFRLYMPLAASWRVYDNSRSGPPLLVAYGAGLENVEIYDSSRWDLIRRIGEHGEDKT